MKRLYSCNASIDFNAHESLLDCNTSEVYDFIGYKLISYNSAAAFYSPWDDRFYFVQGVWDCSATTHKHVRKFIKYVCDMSSNGIFIKWYSAANARQVFAEPDGPIALVRYQTREVDCINGLYQFV